MDAIRRNRSGCGDCHDVKHLGLVDDNANAQKEKPKRFDHILYEIDNLDQCFYSFFVWRRERMRYPSLSHSTTSLVCKITFMPEVPHLLHKFEATWYHYMHNKNVISCSKCTVRFVASHEYSLICLKDCHPRNCMATFSTTCIVSSSSHFCLLQRTMHSSKHEAMRCFSYIYLVLLVGLLATGHHELQMVRHSFSWRSASSTFHGVQASTVRLCGR